MSRCALCQRLVGDFQGVSDVLSESLQFVEATPGLKEGILSQARSEIQPEKSPQPVQRSADQGLFGRGWRWPNWFAPMSVGFATALVIVVAGLVAWNMRLQQNTDRLLGQNSLLQIELDDLSRDSSNLTELVSLVVSGASVSTIPGTEHSPDSVGALIQSLQTQQAVLLIDNIAQLPANQNYQVWHIANEVPTSAGTFFVGESREIVVPLDVGFSDADLLGVSIEPAGGSDTPTGDIVMLGNLQ